MLFIGIGISLVAGEGGGGVPSVPTLLTWGDGTQATWGDATQVTWSA